MGKKKIVLILILVFVLLLGGAYVLYTRLEPSLAPDQLAAQTTKAADDQNDSADSDAKEQVAAPDFTVYDASGNPVKLSDYFGKPIVLNFWASWCGPCQMEMPDFQEKYEALDGQVQFLMINMTDGSRETVNSASEFIKKQGYTFPVLYDTETDAAAAYSANSLPTTFFIDAKGYVIAQATGAISGDTLQRGIDMITEA